MWRTGPERALFLLMAAGACLGQVRAGAAKRTITPDLSKGPVYLAGFGQNRVATGVHDDLNARCLALSAGRTVVICGVDSIGLFLEDVEAIRKSVAARLAERADVVVAALHDHEAPDTMGLWGPAPGQSGIRPGYNTYVVERTAEAAAEAVWALRKAVLKLAKVRNPELDSFIHDDRPPDVHDSEVIALQAVGTDGKPVATLLNWANHPETLGAKNTLVTADYSGYLTAELERRLGGTAVFVNGAVGGMQSPLGAQIGNAAEETFAKAELLGTRVADLAADALRAAAPAKVERIEFVEQTLEIPMANQGFVLAAKAGVFRGRKPLTAGGGTRTVVGMVRLSAGSAPLLEAALVPGELYPELSVGGVERYAGADFPDAPIEAAIKPLMRAPYRMLIGLADDEIGYIIPKAEWDEREPWLQSAPKRWYGEVNSVGPEAAPRIVETIRVLLHARR